MAQKAVPSGGFGGAMICPHCEKETVAAKRSSDGKFDYVCHSCMRPINEVNEALPSTLKDVDELKAIVRQPGAGAVILYDRMVLAINECHRTDEVKEIRDKALAIEYYSRQAKNTEAEQKAIEIRIRAERKAGELLAEVNPGPGGDRKSKEHDAPLIAYAQAKETANISDDQAKRWQKLAEIPKDEFEQALKDPETKPSTSGLIKSSLFKPTSDIAPSKPLDANPRRCTASCCQPDGSDNEGPWNVHDAQKMLDGECFEYRFFGEQHHDKLLKLFV